MVDNFWDQFLSLIPRVLSHMVSYICPSNLQLDKIFVKLRKYVKFLAIRLRRFCVHFWYRWRRVAKMIHIERFGWILNVFFKSILTVLVWCGVVGFDPYFRFNIAGWLKWSILNTWGGFFKSTLTVLVWCWSVGFDPCFCLNIAGWLKWSILNAWGEFRTYFSNPPLLCWYGVGWSVSTLVFVPISQGG